MSNVVKQFIDPAGTYTGGYTSDQLQVVDHKVMASSTRAVIQVEITSGTVNLEMRLSTDAPWLNVRIYDASIMEEVVIGNFLRVIATADARVWLGETI